MKIENQKEHSYILFICLAAFVVMLPIVFLGIPSGNDLPQHYQFAQTYHNSIIGGDGFPSWSDKENYGFGSIGIRFYPPFSYCVLAAFRLLCGNWFDASWVTFVFWMALGCGGVYFWSRRWLSPKTSLIAALFYAVIPYHLSQLYSFSFFYADFAGSAVLPFCFAFLTRILDGEKKSDILGLAVAFTLLVLTHIPTTLIGSLSLAFYALLFVRGKNFWRGALKAGAAGGLGIAASAYFWLPMISEMSWLNHASDRYSTGHYGFANRFFPLYFHALPTDNPKNFLQSDVMIFLCLLFLVSAVVFLIYPNRTSGETSSGSPLLRKILPLGLFGFLMLTPVSTPIWKMLPPLQKTQFPLRWMAIVSMCGSIVLAGVIHFLLREKLLNQRTWSYIVTIFACVIFLYNCIYVWDPGAFIPIARDKFQTQMQALPAERNNTFWWSIWSNEHALKNKEKVLAEGRPASITEWQPEVRTFFLVEGAPVNVRIATFYYPYWKAEVNGRRVEVGMDDNGAILIPLSAERSSVKLFFEEPPKVKFAVLVSLLVWILFGAWGMFILLQKALFAPSRSIDELAAPQPAN